MQLQTFDRNSVSRCKYCNCDLPSICWDCMTDWCRHWSSSSCCLTATGSDRCTWCRSDWQLPFDRYSTSRQTMMLSYYRSSHHLVSRALHICNGSRKSLHCNITASWRLISEYDDTYCSLRRTSDLIFERQWLEISGVHTLNTIAMACNSRR